MRIILLALVSVSISLISHNAEAMFPWGKGGRKDPNSTEMTQFSRSLPGRAPLESPPAQKPVLTNTREHTHEEIPAGITPPKTEPIAIGTGTSRRGSAPAPMGNNFMPNSVLTGSETLLFSMRGVAASAPVPTSLLSTTFQPTNGEPSTSPEKVSFSDEDPGSEEDDTQYITGNQGKSYAQSFIPPHVLTESLQPEGDLIVGSYPGQRLKFNRDGLY